MSAILLEKIGPMVVLVVLGTLIGLACTLIFLPGSLSQIEPIFDQQQRSRNLLTKQYLAVSARSSALFVRTEAETPLISDAVGEPLAPSIESDEMETDTHKDSLARPNEEL